MKGYRKWSVCMASMILAFILALLGKLTAEFASVAAVAVGAFAAAHAVQDYRQGKAP